MKCLELDVRYYHLPSKAGITESDFHHNTLHWSLPADRVALILVDVWSDHYVATHLKRTTAITLERIRPTIEAFRKIGAAVVHAPSPDCARKYPRWTHYAGDDEFGRRNASPPDDWPPADFRGKTGDYARYARPKNPEDRDRVFDAIIQDRRIVPDVEPDADDYVVLNGAQLHRLLKHRQILHLFYAGFAANMCVPFRDYGTRAMKARGYDIILIRDCTTAIEIADTAKDLTLSRAAVIDTELNVGYTVSSKDLNAACENAR